MQHRRLRSGRSGQCGRPCRCQFTSGCNSKPSVRPTLKLAFAYEGLKVQQSYLQNLQRIVLDQWLPFGTWILLYRSGRIWLRSHRPGCEICSFGARWDETSGFYSTCCTGVLSCFFIWAVLFSPVLSRGSPSKTGARIALLTGPFRRRSLIPL